MGRKYESITGKEGTFLRWDGFEFKCVVSGCDWSLGITLQDAEDKTHYLVCINGPMSPLVNGRKFNHKLHRKLMAYTYDQIKAGKPVTTTEYIAIHSSLGTIAGGSPSAETCAFSQ